MTRIFFVIAIVVIGLLILRIFKIKRHGQQALKQVTDTVRCAHCGVHIAQAHALKAGGEYFCCGEHKTLHSK
ncbi:MAG: PP0621 family protein [Gammaproteobacteria bacterium]